MANKIEISHEERASGNYIQHIKVNGIELSGRTVSKGENSPLYNDFVIFLNGKAQEELAKNPRFAWTNLKDFRSWATGYVKEYNKVSEEDLASKILASVEEANTED